jgi:hypothetical protein
LKTRPRLASRENNKTTRENGVSDTSMTALAGELARAAARVSQLMAQEEKELLGVDI